jgi:hypothetical protein
VRQLKLAVHFFALRLTLSGITSFEALGDCAWSFDGIALPLLNYPSHPATRQVVLGD